MAGETRRFYTRYYMLTVVAPAYFATAVFYGTAWLLVYLTKPVGPGSTILTLGAFYVVVLLLSPLPEWLAGLGFAFSGVTRSATSETTAAATKLADVLPIRAVDNRPAPELTPRIVELGPVPFLAVGGRSANQLWISTHLLQRATLTQLRCLIAHEAGHLASAEPDRRGWLTNVTWLAALPLAIILAQWPLLLVAAALLHALAWLRFSLQRTMRTEAEADAWASAVVGRRLYAAALLEYHGWIAGNRWPTALADRLQRIGYSATDIEAARRSDSSGNAD